MSSQFTQALYQTFYKAIVNKSRSEDQTMTGIASTIQNNPSSRQCALTVYTSSLDGVSSQFTQALHQTFYTIHRLDNVHSQFTQAVLTVCPHNLHRHCIKRFTQSIVSTMCTHSLHKQSRQCVPTIHTCIAYLQVTQCVRKPFFKRLGSRRQLTRFPVRICIFKLGEKNTVTRT